MFNTYDFTYAGTPASMFGMYVADYSGTKHGPNSFGTKANLVEQRIANRVTPIHYGVRWHDDPLKFTLIFGADHELDRYEMQEVSKWLLGYQDYQWLSIDQPDMEHMQFRCIVQELTPIHNVWLPIGYEAKIQCDCPYAYSYPFSKTFRINGETKVRFYNDSTCHEHLKPVLTVALDAGCTAFSAENRTVGSDAVQFTGLPAEGVAIVMDNENEVVTCGNGLHDLYDNFNFRFFELASGDNELVFRGQGSVTISGRYRYNVGA